MLKFPFKFGPTLGADNGGIINKQCDAKYPVGDYCETGWKYTDGNSWIDDPTIELRCKDFSKNNVESRFKQNQKMNDVPKLDTELSQRPSLVNLDQIQMKIPKQKTPCKKFILKSDGRTKTYQESRLGIYLLQEDIVNGKNYYFNEEKGQYFSWIDKYDGYWMVTTRRLSGVYVISLLRKLIAFAKKFLL